VDKEMNKSSKIPAFVMARLSSVRLPKKALLEINGKPVIEYVFESLKRCENVSEIIVLTSLNKEDDELCEWAKRKNIEIFRGPLNEVASRALKAADKYGCDSFVRISGDSPLINHQFVDYGISLFDKHNYDLVTNTYPRTFPKGQSVEIISTKTLNKILQKNISVDENEHVTKFFYNNYAEFKILNFELNETLDKLGQSRVEQLNVSNIQMSLDSRVDFEKISKIISLLSGISPSEIEFKTMVQLFLNTLTQVSSEKLSEIL
jgi:spore coat polysaccharide biosynthesis protein SpsF